ncbi:hypothetical protein LUZ60_000267 [Juncus effusus]|nr:hypothetical protein LUZ60_000267 [Juncus effusus]
MESPLLYKPTPLYDTISSQNLSNSKPTASLSSKPSNFLSSFNSLPSTPLSSPTRFLILSQTFVSQMAVKENSTLTIDPCSSSNGASSSKPAKTKGSTSPISRLLSKLFVSNKNSNQDSNPVPNKNSEDSIPVPAIGVSFDHSKSGELERVFHYFDENKNGKISPSELHNCMQSTGGECFSLEEVETVVRLSDSDGDGELSLDDFLKLAQAEGEEEKNENLMDAFRMYEMDGRGCITPKSLRRMLGRLGDHRTVEDCVKMIRRFDLNGDGVLSFDEFKLMMI